MISEGKGWMDGWMDPNDIRGECWELPFWNSGDNERARPERGEGARSVTALRSMTIIQ